MRLHSAPFEKRLRRRVRQEIRYSPALKAEFRRTRKVRRNYKIALLLRPLISVGLGIGIWQMLDRTKRPSSALALVTLWAFAFVFIQAEHFLKRLYHSRDLAVLLFLPVSERVVFRWGLQKFLLGSLWLLLDFLSAYSVLALALHLSTLQWCLAAALAVATWLETVALAVLSVRFAPRWPYHLASSVLWTGLFLLYLTRPLLSNAVVVVIDECAPALNGVLPTGWPVSLFQAILPGTPSILLLFLFPVVLIIASLKRSLSRLEADYYYSETVQQEFPDLVPESANAEMSPSAASDSARPLRVGPTAIEEIVLTRQFLAKPSWPSSGALERALWGRLKERERTLTEFTFPQGFAFGAAWKRIFRNLGIACLAGLTVGLANAGGRNWILGAGLFVTICQALGQFMANGRAFQPTFSSGVNIPLYAGFGIGFRELGQLLFKWSFAQFPWLASFAICCGMLTCYLMDRSVVEGAVIGIKVGGLLLAGRFILIALAFSAGTNDTSTRRLRSFAIIGLVLLCALSFVGLALGSLFIPQPYVAWLLWGLAAVDAYLLFRIYGWFYDGSLFDLMNVPRN